MRHAIWRFHPKVVVACCSASEENPEGLEFSEQLVRRINELRPRNFYTAPWIMRHDLKAGEPLGPNQTALTL